QLEWFVHQPLAVKAGIAPAVTADLAQGRHPAGMAEDEEIVYQFCKEVHETKTVSDSVFKAAVDKFGERGVIDLIGLTGYYSMLAMVLNVAQQPLPGGVPPPLPALK
ncbi:MAG: carboxymuconolactone decarboxylase family protein, partial [Sulfuricaulis sp.]|nr:carboxymuconolactone decarboxylase family protein [Sulfuricaulis sp.]